MKLTIRAEVGWLLSSSCLCTFNVLKLSFPSTESYVFIQDDIRFDQADIMCY